jgi:hypothetical protein
MDAHAYMDNREFTLGVIDKRAGRPFRAAYEQWSTQQQWYYETGRQLACVLPPDLKTRTSTGKPNPKALRILKMNRGVVR